MSEPVRKNLILLIDDLFDQMISTIASDRQVKVDEVRALVDLGLIMVSKAHEGGLVGGKLCMGGLYEKIGISTDLITRGKNSDMFSVTTKFTESERAVVSLMMQDVYRLFTTKAAEGRNLPLDKLEALAGGQVCTGRDAKRNGLVDGMGTLKDAVNVAKNLAGLDVDAKIGLEVLPEAKNPLEEIFDADFDSEREAHLYGGISHLLPF